MKSTFKFEFHILYYIIGLFCILTGYFKSFIWISLLIIIHECGHVTAAILCNWKIEKVVIMPFGGMTTLKESLNKPLYQEWFIVLLGPIYQMLCYSILCLLHKTNSEFTLYHYFLLGFNLLPIIPLDGSKMFQLILERFFSYQSAKYVGLMVSILGLLILNIYLIYKKNIIFGIIMIFLWIQNIQYFKKIPYQVYKFLLERYLYTFSFTKYHKIRGINLKKMKRGYFHLFIENGSCKTEDEVLQRHFQTKRKMI